LVKNDITTRDVTVKIQQMAVHRNYKITANTVKDEEECRCTITLG